MWKHQIVRNLGVTVKEEYKIGIYWSIHERKWDLVQEKIGERLLEGNNQFSWASSWWICMGVSSLVIMTPPSSSLQFLNLTISSFPLSESRPPCNFTTFTHNLTTTFTYIYQPPYKFLIPLNPSIAYFPFDILEGKETRTGFKTGKMSIRGTPSKRNTSSISFYKRKARSKRYRIQVHMLNRYVP